MSLSVNGELIWFAVLEVYQFARDAAVAQTWLFAQEGYLTTDELGVKRFLLSLNARVNDDSK